MASFARRMAHSSLHMVQVSVSTPRLCLICLALSGFIAD
jgi:hypothetical protein